MTTAMTIPAIVTMTMTMLLSVAMVVTSVTLLVRFHQYKNTRVF